MKKILAAILIVFMLTAPALASALDTFAEYNELLTGLWQELKPGKDKEPRILNINVADPNPGYFPSEYSLYFDGTGEIYLIFTSINFGYSISGTVTVNADASRIMVVNGEKISVFERIG